MSRPQAEVKKDLELSLEEEALLKEFEPVRKAYFVDQTITPKLLTHTQLYTAEEAERIACAYAKKATIIEARAERIVAAAFRSRLPIIEVVSKLTPFGLSLEKCGQLFSEKSSQYLKNMQDDLRREAEALRKQEEYLQVQVALLFSLTTANATSTSRAINGQSNTQGAALKA